MVTIHRSAPDPTAMKWRAAFISPDTGGALVFSHTNVARVVMWLEDMAEAYGVDPADMGISLRRADTAWQREKIRIMAGRRR